MYDYLTQRAYNVLSEQYGLGDVAIEWVRPQDRAHGDVATALALQLSKKVGKSPADIAGALCHALESVDEVDRAEVAGPGYVNIWLRPVALLSALVESWNACRAIPTRNEEDPVIVEYSQPNVAKPLGAHHLLTTLIGQAISNLYSHAGYNVVRWNYLGDWGTQFGKLAVAYELWGDGKPVREHSLDQLLDLYVRFHEEAEKDPSLEERGRAAFRTLEQGDKDLQQFWEDVVLVTKASLDVLYERLHVAFDTDLGESFYQDKMDSILEEGKEKGVFVEGEGGSLIVQFPEESGMPPYLVQKSDGATLYSTRDIAQMRYRIDTYHPQAIYIVTDVAQKLHFEQLESTCDQLQWELPTFKNVLFGRMRFADKKMSTRKGNILKLEEVLSEAVRRADAIIAEHGEDVQAEDHAALAEMMGVGSVAYGILSQNRKMDIVFDWDRMLSFDGNSAPYLQYTHARARSVLERAGASDVFSLPENVTEFAEMERVLVGTLLQFTGVLAEARESQMPHILTNYLFELCQDFNAFYNVEPILKASEPQRSLRLALTALTAAVLKTGADLLTIQVPDRM